MNIKPWVEILDNNVRKLIIEYSINYNLYNLVVEDLIILNTIPNILSDDTFQKCIDEGNLMQVLTDYNSYINKVFSIFYQIKIKFKSMKKYLQDNFIPIDSINIFKKRKILINLIKVLSRCCETDDTVLELDLIICYSVASILSSLTPENQLSNDKLIKLIIFKILAEETFIIQSILIDSDINETFKIIITLAEKAKLFTGSEFDTFPIYIYYTSNEDYIIKYNTANSTNDNVISN
jgi:hypothetical protein